jgi:hypothetical protein
MKKENNKDGRAVTIAVVLWILVVVLGYIAVQGIS